MATTKTAGTINIAMSLDEKEVKKVAHGLDKGLKDIFKAPQEMFKKMEEHAKHIKTIMMGLPMVGSVFSGMKNSSQVGFGQVRAGQTAGEDVNTYAEMNRVKASDILAQRKIMAGMGLDENDQNNVLDSFANAFNSGLLKRLGYNGSFFDVMGKLFDNAGSMGTEQGRGLLARILGNFGGLEGIVVGSKGKGYTKAQTNMKDDPQIKAFETMGIQVRNDAAKQFAAQEAIRNAIKDIEMSVLASTNPIYARDAKGQVVRDKNGKPVVAGGVASKEYSAATKADNIQADYMLQGMSSAEIRAELLKSAVFKSLDRKGDDILGFLDKLIVGVTEMPKAIKELPKTLANYAKETTKQKGDDYKAAVDERLLP